MRGSFRIPKDVRILQIGKIEMKKSRMSDASLVVSSLCLAFLIMVLYVGASSVLKGKIIDETFASRVYPDIVRR